MDMNTTRNITENTVEHTIEHTVERVGARVRAKVGKVFFYFDSISELNETLADRVKEYNAEFGGV